MCSIKIISVDINVWSGTVIHPFSEKMDYTVKQKKVFLLKSFKKNSI